MCCGMGGDSDSGLGLRFETEFEVDDVGVWVEMTSWFSVSGEDVLRLSLDSDRSRGIGTPAI